jgi:hypothetical protein
VSDTESSCRLTGVHELPELLLGPFKPYQSMSCGWLPLKQLYSFLTSPLDTPCHTVLEVKKVVARRDEAIFLGGGGRGIGVGKGNVVVRLEVGCRVMVGEGERVGGQ